jgi:hypothetical protein
VPLPKFYASLLGHDFIFASEESGGGGFLHRSL